MAPVPKKSRRTGNQYRSAQTGIPDYAIKGFDEQVALFSKLALENSKKPIYRVWSKLDPVAHSVILSELGCFGESKRQLLSAQYHEWAQEDSAELKRHVRKLRTFLKRQAEHENIKVLRPRFYMPLRYVVQPEGIRGTLGKMLEMEIVHLKKTVAHINRGLKKRRKWDARGMVLSQEYVIRRADFLGISGRVRLTPEAIADIYQLTRRTGDGGDDSGTPEKIQKAIAYFRKDPENAYFVQNIEFYLEDWKKPVLKTKSGN
jgi:hypothetical protein